MADCYTLFSEVVPALTAAERAWAEQVLGDGSPAALADAGVDPAAVDADDDWPGFGWSVIDAGLWVYSDGSGSVAHVTAFVRAFLARFRPGDGWRLAWAETCSKPRPGQFGGGAAFVTAGGVEFCSAHGWLDDRERRFRSAGRPFGAEPA